MHEFPIRIYYEDTDHSGSVYHANYLKFMERGRTEMLRAMGIELDALRRDYGVTFAVTEANIRFARPAGFNDRLVVESRIDNARGARMRFTQRISRAGDVLAEAEIHLACLGNRGGPARIPDPIMGLLAHRRDQRSEQ